MTCRKDGVFCPADCERERECICKTVSARLHGINCQKTNIFIYTSNPTYKERSTCSTQHSISQAATRVPFTADVRFLSKTFPCGICGGQSDIGTSSSPSNTVFLCQCHSTCALFSFIRLSSTLYYPNKRQNR